MRRPMSLLCLIAALSGTPLRQVEAANDLARSIAEFGCGDIIEEIDGGVGDDSGETVLETAGEPHRSPASFQSASDWLAIPLRPDASFRRFVFDRRDGRASPIPARSSRRHAWLQCFLF